MLVEVEVTVERSVARNEKMLRNKAFKLLTSDFRLTFALKTQENIRQCINFATNRTHNFMESKALENTFLLIKAVLNHCIVIIYLYKLYIIIYREIYNQNVLVIQKEGGKVRMTYHFIKLNPQNCINLVQNRQIGEIDEYNIFVRYLIVLEYGWMMTFFLWETKFEPQDFWKFVFQRN